jgi:uncharacterized membrane protein YgdD (TMEM256/DUF423 family)
MGEEMTDALGEQGRLFVVIGSLSAFLAVALGAFAAHGLKDKLSPELFAIWEVGVRYHLYHAVALFAVAWVAHQWPAANAAAAGWLFVAGTVIFSGSLYALSLSGLRWLGAVTPVGGLCFLAGWGWLAWSMWRSH